MANFRNPFNGAGTFTQPIGVSGKCVSYYASSPAALAMEAQYGSHLQALSPVNLRAAQAILSKVAYCVMAADEAGHITDITVESEIDRGGYWTIDPTLRSLLIRFDEEPEAHASAFCVALAEYVASRRG